MTETDLPPLPPAIDPRVLAEVGLLLSRARLPLSAVELAELAASYPLQQAGIEALYAVPEARCVEPTLRFRADGRPPGQAT
ncbi:hypothetical protein [Actinomadura napierensis]|uniref:Uncharacterized protein n=1 Tax=Actinomadura napierensis TaxID=267854 RepID=A0ABN2ZSZ8_9ACTN